MTQYDLGKVVGDDGADGNGIASIEKTSTSGLVDTYTITYDNGDTDTFTVTNGSNATVDIVTSWNTTTSDSKVPSEKLSKTSLDGKLDNALSSTAVSIASNDNILITDYSDSNKIKRVANILAGQVKDSTAHSNIGSSANATQATINSSIDTALSNKISKSQTAGLVKNDGTIDTTSYAASSSVPTKISDLNNDSDFIEKSSTTGLIKNDGTIDTSSYITSSALSGYQTTSNLVTSFSSTTSDSKYPSEKLTKTELDKKIEKSNTSGLVKNDGSIDTNTYLTSSDLTGYQTTANLVTSFSGTTSDSKYPSEKLTKTELDKKISKSNSATGLLKDDGTVMTSGTGSSNWAVGNHTHSAYVNPTKVTSWSSTPSDSNVASEKLIKDTLDTKQATLVSGTNIKTINSTSLLGSGNIATLTSSDIADNLTTNDSTKVLSARQGKALNDLIGSAISYINQ